MVKKFILIVFAILLIVGFSLAEWRYNPLTGKLDYYVPAGVAAAHAATHAVGGSDQVNHNTLLNYAANRHFLQSEITVVGTIGTGVWQGTAIVDTYVSDTITVGASGSVNNAALDVDLQTLATPTPWRLFYSDGSNVITELALGASGYLKTNGATSAPTWDTPAGSGDFVGPGSSTDNALVRFDGTTGKLGQDSAVTVSDTGVVTIAKGGETLDIDVGTDVTLTFSGTGSYVFVSSATTASSATYYERTAAGSNYITLTAQDMVANVILTLPNADAVNANTPLVDADAGGGLAFSGNIWLDDITGTTEVTINDGSADLDFRIESNNDANIFVIDAGVDEGYFGRTFLSEYVDNGNAGATPTIDWGASNKQKITLDQTSTFTFTAPDTTGAASLTLIVIQDGTGNRTVTWPGTVDWGTDGAPTLSTGANKQDMIMFFWDGSEYKGGYKLGF